METKANSMKDEKDKLDAQDEALVMENSEDIANVSNILSNAQHELRRVQTMHILLDDKVSVLESIKENTERRFSTTKKTAKDFECKLFDSEAEVNQAKGITKQSLQRQHKLKKKLENWSAKAGDIDVAI
jgi:hypothetical protein